MTEEMLTRLEEKGNRIAELLNRFGGNESICVRLVKKFPGDENYKNYVQQIQALDFSSAEQSVHTLKGVSSNLGLTKISDLTQLIVNELRGDRDMQKISSWNEELACAYQETIDVIAAYIE